MQVFLLALLTCSVTMSAASLVFLAASLLSAKFFCAKSRYYIWLVIVVGLLIPFRPSFAKAALEINVPAAASASTFMNIESQIESNNSEAQFVPSGAAAFHQEFRAIPWWNIAFIVWAFGAVLLLACFIISHLRYAKAARRLSKALTSGPAFELLQELRGKKIIALYQCSCIDSPLTMGLFRHCIFLPHTNFDADELRCILAHEIIHINRRDLWFKVLTLTANAIHWFNPIVYLTRKNIDLMCEISCDDEIVRGANADTRLQYAETIISVVRYQTKQQFAISTGFYTGKMGVKTRISAIMDTSKKQMGTALLCAALFVTIGSGFVFAATMVEPSEHITITKTVNPDVILQVLSNWDISGPYVQHDPMPGQISQEEAFAIAKAAVPYTLRQLSVQDPDIEPDFGMIGIGAFLGQQRFKGFEEIPRDPEYSQWEVFLRGADGLSDIKVDVLAQTGAVWLVRASFIKVNSDLEISMNKLLYGFMNDLGFGGFEYDETDTISVRELNKLGRQTTSAFIEDSKGRVGISVRSKPVLMEGEPFDEFSYLSFEIALLPPGREIQ